MIPFHINAGPLAAAYVQACARLDRDGFADALWARRPAAWTDDPATQQAIANRLGWLTAYDVVEPQLTRLRTVADTIRADGFTDVVLLGMGGSSLAPEVLRSVFGVARGFPRFHVLDSVDPDAVRGAMSQAQSSLFILASKSGTTIEPNVMAAEARRRLEAAGHTDWGGRFIAITDPDTELHRRATSERFREIFVNPADIGGRYSALSFFGMVPAALMGIDVAGLLVRAREMESACRSHPAAENPGLALGALMAAGALSARDKLTLLLPPALGTFGLWVEQLVAESTGKKGKGVVPITGESASAPLGADRVLVSLAVDGERPDDGAVQRSGTAAPVAELQMPDVTAIGAEFLRWEIATAAAGALMQINPFDEPNVQQAKDATRVLLDGYTRTGRLPRAEPHASSGGVVLTLSDAAQQELAGEDPHAFLRVVRPGDYVGVLAFLPPDESSLEAVLRAFRDRVGIECGCATMCGYGPRYLHSTGQLHKGGPNTGVFVLLTADPAEDLPIPGETFSFGVLEMAQALGDFRSLDHTGRRALHVHLPRRDADLLRGTLATLSARSPR
jgi:glucose-6-phosphate isomerase